MKYAIRAVKYFFYIVIIVAIMFGILMAVGYLDTDINSLFKNGYNSLWQIAIVFALLSALYPSFGFMKKDVIVPGEYNEIRPIVIKAMEERGYSLESEEGENLTFRRNGGLSRLTRMLEDRITLTRDITGFQMEGLRKDVVRLVYAIESKARGEAN
ncbi:MAG: hypothetical protein IJL91_00635 [Bacteroidales bacterium]|nr:hypothetical protein [Bacteroidales bacterium]MBQ6576241.1 hypothetical protein [Bacteroidales bacterium]